MLFLTLALAGDRALSLTMPDGRMRAVVVGVQDFRAFDPADDLKFTEADATAFATALEKGRGVPEDEIDLLVGPEATVRRVSDTVRRALSDAGPNDIVVLYFSTHGLLDGARGYLVAYDTSPTDPHGTALAIDDLEQWIRSSPARDVLLFTDACHSAVVGEGGTRALGGVNTAITTVAAGDRRFFNQASSLVSQRSKEGVEFCGGHGAYTCGLLRVLSGEAELPGQSDGVVTLSDLSAVTEMVRQDTNGLQVPETKGRYDPELVLARIIPALPFCHPSSEAPCGVTLPVEPRIGTRARFVASGVSIALAGASGVGYALARTELKERVESAGGSELEPVWNETEALRASTNALGLTGIGLGVVGGGFLTWAISGTF